VRASLRRAGGQSGDAAIVARYHAPMTAEATRTARDRVPGVDPDDLWRDAAPWRVAPASGFEVADPDGRAGVVQYDDTNFIVVTSFRFSDEPVLGRLRDAITATGVSDAEARERVEAARAYVVTPADWDPAQPRRSDLASIPPFMRWFVNSYGRHSLAAIIHDELILDARPNEGALGSDTLSDTFFREMMRCSGVPWLLRWIMWSAVAMRTRWAALGWRRATLVTWVVLAAAGIAMFVWAVGSLAGWGHVLPPGVMLTIALVMPFAAAPLWGRQYGAGLVAAVAALWILPAATFGLVGVGVYRVLEWGAGRILRLR